MSQVTKLIIAAEEKNKARPKAHKAGWKSP